MTTEISTKLSAVAAALLVNCLMIGGVAYLFTAKAHAGNVYQATQTTACESPACTAGARARV